MDNLKRMSNQQLATYIIYYIESTQILMDDIADVLEGKGTPLLRNQIYEKYKKLKQELREDSHYLGLMINSRTDKDSDLYNGFFKPSIREAAAWGFYSPSNCKISQKMYDAVEEAHYKLTKYYSLDKWKEIAEFDN